MASGTDSEGARVETSAGGVVYRRGIHGVRLLLIRDPYDNWGLPKGHIEEGETPVEAGLREVAEETGLDDLHVEGELPTIDWYFRLHGRLIHKHCHFFLMRSPTGEPRPQLDEGISACRWCAGPDALALMSYDNARGVLRAAADRVGAASADSSSEV